MTFAGRWWGAVLLTLAAARMLAAEPHIVVCRHQSGCVASVDVPEELDFAWIWWDGAPPVRALASDAEAILAQGPPRATPTLVHVRPRGEAALSVIAAPAAMWEEVPEPLLPRFAVPKSGTVVVPRTRNVRWKVRLAGKDGGSWWTSIENTAVAISPLPAPLCRVRVAGEDGAPLASAGIAVSIARAGAARELAAQYSTDRGGWFEIEGLPDREPLTFIVSAEGHAPAAFSERLPDLPEVIELRRGVSVTGHFVDAEETPLAGVRVRAEAWLGSRGGVVARATSSAADGSWTITGLPRGVRTTLVATRGDYGPLRRDFVVEKTVDLGAIVLEKGVALPVRVIDAGDRRPVTGAKVSAGPGRETKSDAKGLARLIDLSPSASLELSASADGYLPHTLELSPPLDALVEVELTRAFVVEGRFEDRNGMPVAGATARIVIDDSFRDEPLDGAAFRIPLPPGRRVSLELSSPLSRPVRLDLEGAPGETRNLGIIRVDEGRPVRGRIISAEGIPVAAASVWMPRTTVAGPVVEWATGNVLRTESDPEGNFLLRGAGPESALLRIDAPGFARTLRPVSFDAEGGDADLGDIVVSRGVTVEVRGRAEWTDAIVQATVRPETGAIDVLSATIHQGVAVLRNLSQGRAVISVMREHSMLCRKEIEIDGREEAFTVDCSSGAVRVSGTVFAGAHPADGGMLLWTPASSGVAAGVIMNSTSRLGAVHQQPYGAAQDVLLNVDEHGEFASSALWSGTWRVRWTSAAGGMSEPREVVIEEKPDVRVVLRYDGAIVRGLVVDDRLQPVGRVSVRPLEGNAAALTLDDGTFTIFGLAPGTYRFRAEERDLRSDVAVVEIEAGRDPEPVRMILRRDRNDAMTVGVRAADGTPAVGALVFVETATGETRIVTTGSDGRASVSFEDGVPAMMRFAATHDGGWVFDDWRPSESVREGRTLAFSETGALAVDADAAGGAPPDIRTPYGWNLHMLLLRIGSVPLLGADAPLQIFGLPPGVYDVSVGSKTIRAMVRRGETTKVSFRR